MVHWHYSMSNEYRIIFTRIFWENCHTIRCLSRLRKYPKSTDFGYFDTQLTPRENKWETRFSLADENTKLNQISDLHYLLSQYNFCLLQRKNSTNSFYYISVFLILIAKEIFLKYLLQKVLTNNNYMLLSKLARC